MHRDIFFRSTLAINSDGQDEERSIAILAVGAPGEWQNGGHSLPNDADLAFVDFDDVTEDLLCRLTPRVILSPLLAHRFDCFDLAVQLQAANFAGQYRAISRSLPRPDIVTREIRQLCPRIDFDILIDG